MKGLFSLSYPVFLRALAIVLQFAPDYLLYPDCSRLRCGVLSRSSQARGIELDWDLLYTIIDRLVDAWLLSSRRPVAGHLDGSLTLRYRGKECQMTVRMDPDAAQKDESLLAAQKIDLRRSGVFFIFGALVFLVQGFFNLGGNVSWVLLEALVIVYALAFENRRSVKPQISLKRRLFRLLGWFALFLVVVVVVLLAWGWIWRGARIDFPYLAAITCGLIGLGLIGWSYLDFSSK